MVRILLRREVTMSTEANIQIAKKAYADFGRGDIAAILAVLDDNVEWTTPGEGVPTAGTRRGKAEVARFFETVAATWNFQAFEPRDYIASGDQVVVCGSYTATARSTGRQITSEWVMVWKLSDGKVTNFREHTDTAALAGAVSGRAAA